MTRIREEELNSIQNVYFQIVIFWKLTEWCRFVTYLWNNPRKLNTKHRVTKQWHRSITYLTKLRPLGAYLETSSSTAACSPTGAVVLRSASVVWITDLSLTCNDIQSTLSHFTFCLNICLNCSFIQNSVQKLIKCIAKSKAKLKCKVT